MALADRTVYDHRHLVDSEDPDLIPIDPNPSYAWYQTWSARRKHP